jgi:hypothetical protein
MRTSQTPNLPITTPEYNADNEQVMRRTAEQYLQDLRNDIVTIRDQKDKSTTLAIRRHQFLLMGAT